MKIKLVAAIQENLQDLLRKETWYNGLSQRRKVVLCSTETFLLGYEEDWYDVFFEKQDSEVFVDIDDGTDYDVEWLNDNSDYMNIPIAKLKIGQLGTYGIFVYSIKPSEITKIEWVKVDADGIEKERKEVYRR